MSSEKGTIVEDLSVSVKKDMVLTDKHDRWTLLDESTIDYGYLSQTGGSGISEEVDKTFYLTTAINYTNGPAHIGHAYEGVTSDVISRFQRLKGDRPCYFVTGADEHGQKIAATAAGQEKEPQEICDKVRREAVCACVCFFVCADSLD